MTYKKRSIHKAEIKEGDSRVQKCQYLELEERFRHTSYNFTQICFKEKL